MSAVGFSSAETRGEGEGEEPEFKSWVLEEAVKGLVEEEIFETGRNEG